MRQNTHQSALSAPNGSDVRRLRQLRALMAPLAQDSGAVIEDTRMLALAREVCDALLHEDADGGLTRSELAQNVSPEFHAHLDSRVNVFVNLGLLQTYTAKRHQQRYVLNMAGYIGLMVAERIGERGGIEELLNLLHRTRQEILAQRISEDVVSERLIEARRVFVGFCNELRRRCETDTLEELIEYSRGHDSTEPMSEVASLNELVADRYPSLSDSAAALIRAAQGYETERAVFMDLLVVESAARRDFSLLDPDDYRSAALTADLDGLAQVAAELIFDVGTPVVSPAQIVDAISDYRPRPTTRRRPSEPPPSDGDPMAAWEQARERRLARTARTAELHLAGGDERELTDTLRGQPWTATAETLADLLMLHQRDPVYRLELRDSVLIDTEAPVTYFSPATLHANRRRQAASPEPAVDAQTEVRR